MLVNKYSILDAMIYANSQENCQMFLKLEHEYNRFNDLTQEYIFVSDEELLDYISKVNSIRFQTVKNNKKVRTKRKKNNIN